MSRKKRNSLFFVSKRRPCLRLGLGVDLLTSATVVVSGPSAFLSQRLQDNTTKCLHRLRGMLNDGRVLPGGGNIEAHVADKLRRHMFVSIVVV